MQRSKICLINSHVKRQTLTLSPSFSHSFTHTHTHAHLQSGTALGDTSDHSDIYFARFSLPHSHSSHSCILSYTYEIMPASVHTLSHTHTHTHTHIHTHAFCMHTEATENTDSHTQAQMFLHPLQPVSCPPHMLIHITCCSYVTLLLTTHLHYSDDCTHFPDRFCCCIEKHPTSRIQQDCIYVPILQEKCIIYGT